MIIKNQIFTIYDFYYVILVTKVRYAFSQLRTCVGARLTPQTLGSTVYVGELWLGWGLRIRVGGSARGPSEPRQQLFAKGARTTLVLLLVGDCQSVKILYIKRKYVSNCSVARFVLVINEYGLSRYLKLFITIL